MSDRHADTGRLRQAFLAPPEHATSGDCPSSESIWKAVAGDLDAAALARVLDHTATCSACAESWRMARAIGNEAGVHPSGKVRLFPQRRRALVWGAVAATVVLAFFVVPTLDERPVPPVEFRDPSRVQIESLLDESVAVARDGVVLRWSGGPDGTLYTVEVANADLFVLVRSEPLEATEYAIPVMMLDTVPDGATLYWRVDAVLPDSTAVSSGTFLLRLR